MNNHIQFPGLGLEFSVPETAFTVFGLEIKWYGIILTTGILLSFLLFYYLAVKKELIDADTVYNITLLILPIAIFGARFVYVITEWENRFKGKGFINMINIRQGGIAIYGAIIFGLATVLIYNKIKKRSSLAMLDALAPAVMLGQVIGRWGNFVNAEAYGWSEGVEKLPWRMVLDYYVIDGVKNPSGVTCVHPTFIYESLWNLIGLAIIIFVLYRKKKFNGEIFFAYMGWYGLGRAYIETLRADSLYIIPGKLKFSVFVGIVCVIAAIIGTIVLYRRHKEEAGEMENYESAFATVKIAMGESDALDQSVFETGSSDECEEDEEELDENEELDNIEENETESLDELDSLDGDKEDEE